MTFDTVHIQTAQPYDIPITPWHTVPTVYERQRQYRVIHTHELEQIEIFSHSYTSPYYPLSICISLSRAEKQQQRKGSYLI